MIGAREATMIETVWSELAGLRMMHVRVGGALDADAPAQAAGLIESAISALAAAGFGGDRIVRSRVWARSARLRQVASDARLVVLTGERRAASSSFIVPGRLPQGIDAAVDLIALEGPGEKSVREYDPRIAPPRFLTRDGLVFLSGITDTVGDFSAQLEAIRARIGQSLEMAGASSSNIIDVRAFVHAGEPWRAAHDAIRARFPCPVEMTSVEGYSAAEKRVEIEVTARV
jgi:enamine deaminase RidA (YjgF/YER057c/UK114 family)